MLSRKNKALKNKLGGERTYNITYASPQDFELDFLQGLAAARMVGFYVKAAATNDQTVVLANKDDSPVLLQYMPDNLKIAAGESKYFDFVKDVRFSLINNTTTNILYIVPVFEA